MKTYEVWMEGYATNGEYDEAQYLGKHSAESFKEACENAVEELGWGMNYYNNQNNTFWGCKFFDNEIDARKSFG